jgi:hypothetical protein
MIIVPDLPEYIAKQLTTSPPVGSRHDAMRDLSLQMTGEQIPDEEQFGILRAWVPDRDKTDKEIRDLIRGSHKRNPQPAISSPASYRRAEQQPTVIPFAPSGSSQPLPTELAKVTPFEFLQRTYGDDAFICLCRASGEDGINICGTRHVWEWEIAPAEKFSDKHGIWYCINPVTSDGTHATEDVVDYRFCLVECDGDGTEADLERQCSALIESGLPLAAIYSSAGKSIHGLVKIEAGKAAPLFKSRVQRVYEYIASLPRLDKGRKSVAQLSRLPGAYRNGKCQALLSRDVGPSSYPEWEASLQYDDGRRKMQGCPLAELVHQQPNEADTLLGNRYLCRGGGMLLVAPSGHGKSVLAVQASIEWAVGRPAFGIMPAKPIKTLIVQAEDDQGDCIEMAQIVRHIEITDDDFRLLRNNVWLGPLNDLTGQEFIQALDSLLDQFPADVVIITR